MCSLLALPVLLSTLEVPMSLISLLLYVLVFAIVAYGLWWVCTHFGMPAPVLWICGAILLIILLMFAANFAGLNLGSVTLPAPRR